MIETPSNDHYGNGAAHKRSLVIQGLWTAVEETTELRSTLKHAVES